MDNRKIIKNICNLNGYGFCDSEVFNQNYSIETMVIYAMLASHNGKLSATELLEMYGEDDGEEPETVCMIALWALYKGGFIELSTLTDEGMQIISEQLGLIKGRQEINESVGVK